MAPKITVSGIQNRPGRQDGFLNAFMLTLVDFWLSYFVDFFECFSTSFFVASFFLSFLGDF